MSEMTETQKKKFVQLYEQTQKSFLTFLQSKKQNIRAPKSKNTTQKLSQNQMSELKETKNITVVALYEQTPKQFEPQNSLFFCPKKTQKRP